MEFSNDDVMNCVCGGSLPYSMLMIHIILLISQLITIL